MLNSHVAGNLFLFYAFRTIIAVLNTMTRIYVECHFNYEVEKYATRNIEVI